MRRDVPGGLRDHGQEAPRLGLLFAGKHRQGGLAEPPGHAEHRMAASRHGRERAGMVIRKGSAPPGLDLGQQAHDALSKQLREPQTVMVHIESFRTVPERGYRAGPAALQTTHPLGSRMLIRFGETLEHPRGRGLPRATGGAPVFGWAHPHFVEER